MSEPARAEPPQTRLEERVGSATNALQPIPGAPPSLAAPPRGCPFFPRCAYRPEIAETVDPPLDETEPGHFVACHLPREKRRAIWARLRQENEALVS